MADSDKDILITPSTGVATTHPKMTFTGKDNSPIDLKILDDNRLSFEGVQGQVFSISPIMNSGDIFSVNDISGVQSMAIGADGTISMNGEVTFSGAYTFPTSDGAANTVLMTDGSDTLSFGLVDTANIAADAITGAKIADDTINSEHYAAGSIDNEHIADNAINSEHYAAGSIDNEHIADNAINSEHYAAGSIDNEHLADNAVNSDEIAAGAVDDDHLSDGVATGLAGTGMTATSGVLNVIEGTGITANANDIAVTAAQTGITSVLNTGLVIGRDSTDQIKFSTDNKIIFRVGNADGVTFLASGEIEATKFDGALEGNATTATSAGTVGVTPNNAAGSFVNENNLIMFLPDGDSSAGMGNYRPESSADFHYNPSSTVLTVPKITSTLTGNVSGSAGTVTSIGNLTGEVTSSNRATVIAGNVVDEANLKVSNAPTNGYVLTAQSGNTGGLTWAAASGGGSTVAYNDYQQYLYQRDDLGNDSVDLRTVGANASSSNINAYGMPADGVVKAITISSFATTINSSTATQTFMVRVNGATSGSDTATFTFSRNDMNNPVGTAYHYTQEGLSFAFSAGDSLQIKRSGGTLVFGDVSAQIYIDFS